MKAFKVILLLMVPIIFCSGKCEKNDMGNVLMEGYIYEGKSFLSKVYFDPNRENAVVEIQIAKFGYFDTLYPKENMNDSSIVFKGDHSTLTYLSNNRARYENTEHDIKINLNRKERTSDIDNHRKKVYMYMAYAMISDLKVKDNFPEYEFDWDTQSDSEYFISGKYQANYIPDFLKKYQEALINRN